MTTTSSTKPDGESKLSSEASSTSGGRAQGQTASADMAASSEISPQSDKASIGKGKKFTPAQELEILQQQILNCQKAGIDARVTPFHIHGAHQVAIILEDVVLDNGNLMPISAKGAT